MQRHGGQLSSVGDICEEEERKEGRRENSASIDIPEDNTFKFTDSFRLLTKGEHTRPKNEHMKDAVQAMDLILKAPDSDLSNKTDSLSTQEFDRLCRTYSDHSNSPQVKYLRRSR